MNITISIYSIWLNKYEKYINNVFMDYKRSIKTINTS